MGFGSYEEGEQEQNTNEEDNGEAVTKVGEAEDGKDSIEDESVDDMMGYL